MYLANEKHNNAHNALPPKYANVKHELLTTAKFKGMAIHLC